MTLSVIIPTLNEALGIEKTLDALLLVRGVTEVIVVDGGSSDRTVEIAERCGVRVVQTAAGRGVQLHAGAQASRGEALWFVHADTHPPADAVEQAMAALEDGRVAGGNFALRFDGGTRPAKFLTTMYPHFRKLGLAFGDSGIFVRRDVYERVGGFRPFPLFEDLEFLRKVKRQGRFVHLRCELVTSSRRFEGRSFTWTFTRWTALQVMYWMGVPPAWLGRLYYPVRGKR